MPPRKGTTGARKRSQKKPQETEPIMVDNSNIDNNNDNNNNNDLKPINIIHDPSQPDSPPLNRSRAIFWSFCFGFTVILFITAIFKISKTVWQHHSEGRGDGVGKLGYTGSGGGGGGGGAWKPDLRLDDEEWKQDMDLDLDMKAEGDDHAGVGGNIDEKIDGSSDVDMDGNINIKAK